MELNTLRYTLPIKQIGNSKYPWAIGNVKELSTLQNKQFNVNKSQLAIFKTNKNVIVGIDDVCPHRGASLSGGIVKHNCLVCPYHGWEYNEDGKLVCIPSDFMSNVSLKNADVKKYHIHEKYGMLWLLDKPSHFNNIPVCEELDNSNEWKYISGTMDVQGNWLDWIMNSLDISHINFVHDFADEDNGIITNIKIKENEKSISCTANVQPKAASVATNYMQPSDTKSPIHVEFFYPNTTIIKIKLKEPNEFITYTSVIPVDEKNSKISWVFSYKLNKNIIQDPFSTNIINGIFYKQMEKTIKEDQSIITNLVDFDTFNINVKADIFQLKSIKKISDILFT